MTTSPHAAQVRKDEVLSAFEALLATSVMPWSQLEPLVLRDLQSLLNFAIQHSPWWRERLQSARLDAATMNELVASLPITTRTTVQDELDNMAIFIPGSDPKDYPVQKTTGSTGQPVLVVKYWPYYSRIIEALTLLEWKWHERDIAGKVALFRLGIKKPEMVPTPPPLTYLGDAPPQLHMPSVESTVDQLLDGLESFQPNYLLSNPISLQMIAEEQLAKPRAISEISQIMTLADRVTPQLRNLVREAFGARIIDRYSSVEFNLIALQCPRHDHMHQIVPNVHLEVVDENNRPVPSGEPGRVLITGIHGYGMPMLRYEQGDIITMGGPCDTGITWPVVQEVHGRVRSYGIGPDGERKLLTLFHADFLLMREIQDFRLVLFQDGAVFVAQTRVDLSDEQMNRLVTSLQDDVFRGPKEVTVLTRREPLTRPRWKVREIYQLPVSRNPSWTIDDIDALLAAANRQSEEPT